MKANDRINTMKPTRQEVLDLYFLEARHKLIEIAAFLDRVQRAKGATDFRLRAFHEALGRMVRAKHDRASRVLLAFSDPTTEPIPAATTKSACGAWPGRPRATRRSRKS
jgi:hypothetical protein